jgi:hypothetical protein
MKHLKLFEDHIDSIARDMFDLNTTFEINDFYGDSGIRIIGPTDKFVEAEAIVASLGREIYKASMGMHTITRTIRNIYVSVCNDILEKYNPRLQEIEYKIDKWYGGSDYRDDDV